MGTIITIFFQAYATVRWKRNFIGKLKDNDGNWVEGTTSLNPFIQIFFVNLFTSKVEQTDPSNLENVDRKVTTRMNDMLLALFTHDDVRKAVFSIVDLYLHDVFFKMSWHILGKEITQKVLLAINSRHSNCVE